MGELSQNADLSSGDVWLLFCEQGASTGNKSIRRRAAAAAACSSSWDCDFVCAEPATPDTCTSQLPGVEGSEPACPHHRRQSSCPGRRRTTKRCRVYQGASPCVQLLHRA